MLFVNPHTQLEFTVAGKDGTKVEWLGEAGSPNELLRAGLRQDIVSPGDVIAVTGFPHDTDPHHLLLAWITLPDGERVDFR